MASAIVMGAAGWLAVGALVALPFAFFGAPRVLDGAKGSSIAFRLMVVPGAALLWPLVIWRWLALARRTSDAEAES